MTTSQHDLVAALGRAIAQRIGEPRYNLWFGPNTKFTWDDGQLLVGVPNHFFQEWLQSTFADAVRAAASETLGRPMQVRFAIDPELFQAARRAEAEARPLTAATALIAAAPAVNPPPPSEQSAAAARHTAPRRPRQWRRLDDFVVGSCNRVAYASALSIVEAPGEGVNPLVLYGPVGTGKTHLLEGIYVGLRRKHADWRVSWVTAEDFTNRFVQAMRLGKLTAFRHHFRECDALLVDDLQFLAGKKATQEEFLHTFDVLHQAGSQLVLSCDAHPRLGDDWHAELADRLLGGALWGVAPPDPETRLHILRAKAGRVEEAIPEAVLRLLAERLQGNVRELEGALHCLRHYRRIAGRPIDLALAREALGELLRHSVRVFRLADVDAAVCRALRLDAGTLQASARAWAVSHPRMLAMYLARKHTAATYSEIGRHFGGRNHSTAVAAEKKVALWMQAGEDLVVAGRRLPLRDVLDLVERELRR